MKKQRYAIVAGLLALTLLAGCGRPAAPQKEAFSVVAPTAEAAPLSWEEISAQTDAMAAISAQAEAFGLDLASRMEEDTFVFSPFSVYLALAAMMDGATGQTAEDMAAALCPEGMDEAAFQEGIRALLALLEQDEGSLIQISTLVTLAPRYQLTAGFAEAVSNYFGGTTATADFADPQTMEDLNQWAREQTNGMIDPLLTEPLDPDTALALLNSVYFLGRWQSCFDPSLSYEADFHGSDGVSQQTFMTQEGTFDYAETDVFQSVSLPYAGGAAMRLFLPKEGKTTGDVLASLQQGRPEYTPGLGTVTLPRFETESTLPLDSILQSAGLASMYQGGFTELATAEGVPADLLITEVLQKAKISVDEEGTEAAAVTIVAASDGAFLPQGEPFRFLADRPFVYTIDYGNTSLFLGVQSSF